MTNSSLIFKKLLFMQFNSSIIVLAYVEINPKEKRRVHDIY